MHVDSTGRSAIGIIVGIISIISLAVLSGCSSVNDSGMQCREDLKNADDITPDTSISTYNCYGFAIGKAVDKSPSGFLLNSTAYEVFCGVQCDLGGERNCRLLTSIASPVDDGWYMVALRCSQDDFHFIKRGCDGIWQSKEGTGNIVPVSRKDITAQYWPRHYANGTIVYEPSDSRNYTGTIIYFEIRIGGDKE